MAICLWSLLGSTFTGSRSLLRVESFRGVLLRQVLVVARAAFDEQGVEGVVVALAALLGQAGLEERAPRALLAFLARVDPAGHHVLVLVEDVLLGGHQLVVVAPERSALPVARALVLQPGEVVVVGTGGHTGRV